MTDYPKGTSLHVTFHGVIDADGDLDLGGDFIDRDLLLGAMTIKVLDPSFMLGDIVRDGDHQLWEVRPPLVFKALNESENYYCGEVVSYEDLPLPLVRIGKVTG